MLLIEIALTVAAWRKGWRRRALLPLGIAAAIAFSAGVAVGLTDGSEATLRALALVVDLATLATLAIMIARPPRVAEGQAPHAATIASIVESDRSPLAGPKYFPTRPPAAAASRSAGPYAV